MIQPGQASVLDGETGYENRPPGRPVPTRFLRSEERRVGKECGS